MVGIDILAATGIGDLLGVEARTGVAHHDQHAAGVIAGDAALDLFGGVVPAAVLAEPPLLRAQLGGLPAEGGVAPSHLDLFDYKPKLADLAVAVEGATVS